MAPSHYHTIGAGRHSPRPAGAGGSALALTMLGATALLVTPLALWTRFGDDNVVRTAAIVTASILLSAGFVYFTRTPRYPAHRDAPTPSPATTRCRAGVRRTRPLSRPAVRMRVGSPASTFRARPPRRGRPIRDVHCRGTARRTSRRRTRP